MSSLLSLCANVKRQRIQKRYTCVVVVARTIEGGISMWPIENRQPGWGLFAGRAQSFDRDTLAKACVCGTDLTHQWTAFCTFFAVETPCCRAYVSLRAIISHIFFLPAILSTALSAGSSDRIQRGCCLCHSSRAWRSISIFSRSH